MENRGKTNHGHLFEAEVRANFHAFISHSDTLLIHIPYRLIEESTITLTRCPGNQAKE